MTWHDHAACRGMDLAIFFPRIGENATTAKAVCAGCPVREDCLHDALATEVKTKRFGIRGGLSPVERDRLGSPITGRRHRSVAKCGTDAGYYRHLRTLREPACQMCREAHAAYTRLRKATA